MALIDLTPKASTVLGVVPHFFPVVVYMVPNKLNSGGGSDCYSCKLLYGLERVIKWLCA